MLYSNKEVRSAAKVLHEKLEQLDDKRVILKASELGALYDRIKTLPAGKARAEFGREVNSLKAELEGLIKRSLSTKDLKLQPIDVTAPFDVNVPAEQRPKLLTSDNGSRHPLMTELTAILDIFARMGFVAVESRELDDDYHMFGSLNFPKDHPARDEYDTFVTDEGLVAPAHTSIMQNRVFKSMGIPIRAVIPGRCFRKEDVDARHDHTFYQLEGVYVDKGINAGHLIATLKTFFKEYFQKDIKVKTQPFYFPFTEPSFEFTASCPFCDGKGCSICSQTGWIELLGGGIERLVMIKYGIEDIRHFHSGNLKFLRQFA